MGAGGLITLVTMQLIVDCHNMTQLRYVTYETLNGYVIIDGYRR